MVQVSAGDRQSLQILLGRYWWALVSYAASIVCDRDLAQDVVQNTFIRVWERRTEWSESGSVKAYLYRITKNLSLNALRDTELRRTRHIESATPDLGCDATPSPEQDLEAESLRVEVEDAIARLSPRRREVFVLSRFHGLSHREIAESLGTSPQTVSNQISQALDELRDALCHLMRNA